MTQTISLQEQIQALWKIQTLDSQAPAAASPERDELTRLIPGHLLRQYERIRAARQGIGLASPNGSRCSACNMSLPPQLFNDIMRLNALHSCPSCLRLLAPQS